MVFVFGSNLNGFHGAGAAKFALDNRGAIWGQGEGLQGQSYAIPTMHGWKVLADSVMRFLEFAQNNHAMKFEVTRIGCGIAGYNDSQIAPLFAKAPENCQLPDGWREIRG